MILLHNFLTDNRSRITKALFNHIPKEVEIYQKIPRLELRESIEHLYEAHLSLVSSGSTSDLQKVLKYVVKARQEQKIPLGAMSQAFLCFLAFSRTLMQSEFRQNKSTDMRLLFHKTFEDLENTFSIGLSTFCTIYLDQLQRQQTDFAPHYLSPKPKSLNASRYLIIRG